MPSFIEKIQHLQAQAQSFSFQSEKDVEQFRIQYLGTKGILKNCYEDLKLAPVEEKKALGQAIQQFKIALEEQLETEKKTFLTTSNTTTQYSEKDISLPPGDNLKIGARHPINSIKNDIIKVFQKIGFSIAEGPEIEDDWHNFTALNIPETHPARDMQDTFYISQNPTTLLRTHTSNVQIRALKKKELPLRIICPGRVFRNETISARSHCFFHQIEGLYVDKKVSFADLKQTLYFFVKEFFGSDIKIRFRPSYFPFTEPSAEMDISCLICKGKGCSVCKQSGWVEILGSGMVHPQLFKNCGIDEQQYTGYAWGMGVERIAMLKYEIKDLRLFSENDVRFLEQFRGG